MAHDAQMLKGVLALLLLSLLSDRENYGYGIVTTLRERGFVDMSEGTVYPALTRLEAVGDLTSELVRSDAGPARKYYSTTTQGRETLSRRRTEWFELVAAVAATLPEQRSEEK